MKKFMWLLLVAACMLPVVAQEKLPIQVDSRFEKIIKYVYAFPGTSELVLEGVSYNIYWSIPDDLITKTTKDAETAKLLRLSNEQTTGAWVSAGIAAGLLIPAWYFTAEIPKKQTSSEVWTTTAYAFSFLGASLVADIIASVLLVQSRESLFKGINRYNEFVLSQ